jgi:hypothetical protein
MNITAEPIKPRALLKERPLKGSFIEIRKAPDIKSSIPRSWELLKLAFRKTTSSISINKVEKLKKGITLEASSVLRDWK